MTSTPDETPQTTSREAVVAANVRRLREAAGMSQRELSNRTATAGVRLGEMPIWGIETGKRRIQVDDLDVLGGALGVPALSLLQPGAAPGDLCEVLLDGGRVERVLADEVEWGETWVRFTLGGLPVFFAMVGRVLGIRFKNDGDES